ncbi:hypothetical protein [Thiocapsa sp.]|uniref:hypothetical protein n=1 Tax=Thiocapsa sp. TaxID=2024551 RepID=UPI0035940CAB
MITAGGADVRYPVVAAPCSLPLAPFEVEGQTVACGKVSVPEDHAKPDGRRIDLTFMIFKSRSPAPAPDAVVHLHGGPGSGIVNTLGYSTYNAYGISYGTKLAQEVMRTAPEGMRAVVLDSVAPVQVPIYDTLAVPHAESIQLVFDFCKADPKCNAAYPDLRNRFWALWAKLEATPIETPDGTLDTDALFELFAGRNDWKAKLQGLTGYIPKIIAELENGNPRTLLDLRADRIRLHPTPESVMAGLTGLDADILAFAQGALKLVQMGKLNEQAMRLAL